MIFSVRRPQYLISHTKSQRSFVTRHRDSCEKTRGGGGHFMNLWVGMCRWDPGTRDLYQS